MEEPKAAQNPAPIQYPNPPTAAQTAPPPLQQEPPQPPAQAPAPPPPAPAPPPTAPEQPASKKRPLENSNDQIQKSKYFKMRLVLKDLRPHFIEMKLLLEMYKQMTDEQPQVIKPAVPSENKTFQSSNVSEKKQSEDGEAPWTYIVGGSAFGWNFITFMGNKPVYYGVTKESFRSAQATLGGE